MSGRRAESLDFHNPTRQRGIPFLISRSVSKDVSNKENHCKNQSLADASKHAIRVMK